MAITSTVSKYGQDRLLWREVSGVGLRHPESFHQQPVQATFIQSSHSSVAMVPVQEEDRLIGIGPWGVSGHGCCHPVCREELLERETGVFHIEISALDSE